MGEKIKKILEQKDRLAIGVLILAITYYVVSFSVISILAHLNFCTGAHDVGQYDQIIWQLSTFFHPYSTMGGSSLFAFHVSFYCVLLAPLFWIWSNVGSLYIAQSLFLALAVIPLFCYASKKLANPFLALVVSLGVMKKSGNRASILDV